MLVYIHMYTHTHTHTHTYIKVPWNIGEKRTEIIALSQTDEKQSTHQRIGNPLQYSCLENPMDEEPGRLQSMGSRRVGHD